MAFAGDPLAYYGRRILEDHDAALLKRLNLPPLRADSTNDPFDVSDETLRFLPSLKVGILGAGVGGLYTALMLDSLGIQYEILEATNRVGGRISTYKFPNGNRYDYYEEGAMRFPLPRKEGGRYRNGIMKRLGELIDYGPLNQGPDRLQDKLIPFYYTARSGAGFRPAFYYFNGIIQDVTTNPKGPFDAGGMRVGPEYAAAGADAINSDVIHPFARMIINDLTRNRSSGWDVMKANDSYSVRGYMSSKYIPSYSLNLPPQHLSSNVVNWCSLLGSSTGGYDLGLTDSVFEALAFAEVGNSDYANIEWRCFEGGTNTLPDKMAAYIRSRGGPILFGKRVTAISRGFCIIRLPPGFPRGRLPPGVTETQSNEVDVEIEESDLGAETPIDTSSFRRRNINLPCVTVTVNGNEQRKYSHVISTLPLPVLRTINLTNAGLNTLQKNALRELNYGPSIKIAVRFRTNWWTTMLNIVGGQSFTDLPIRTIVYPSYGVDSNTPSTVLIASYTWTADAFRLGALSSSGQQEVLKELVLRNLAEAHGRRDSRITYEYLQGQFVAMHVKDWNQDPQTMGAFAQFGPGQFEDLYTSVNFPAAGNRLHFAGEAISTRHAWVVGALDSAWKAVYEYLKFTDQREKIRTFKRIWGENVEWTSRSTLLDPGQYENEADMPNLLDQYLGLVKEAINSGVISDAGNPV